jgi:hypothetical protein
MNYLQHGSSVEVKKSSKSEMNRFYLLVTNPRRGYNTVARSENPIIHPCRGCKPELCNHYVVENMNFPIILQDWIPYRNRQQLKCTFWVHH